MKTFAVTDTLDLSLPERIQLVEDIWDTIVVEADSVELTEEEKKIINERLEAYYQNPNLGSPWEDAFKRIVSKNER
ncbi:MAG: addiction module protein [Candidatus Desantisbacteria bacterium]